MPPAAAATTPPTPPPPTPTPTPHPPPPPPPPPPTPPPPPPPPPPTPTPTTPTPTPPTLLHFTVIAMLDRAKQLGFLEEVSDEGGFWEKRDVPALVKEIGSWNEMIAALGGKLKDLTGNGCVELESAIAQFPTFEALEAAGQSKLPPELQKLFALMERVRVRPSEGLLL